jgi:hypothetical protein
MIATGIDFSFFGNSCDEFAGSTVGKLQCNIHEWQAEAFADGSMPGYCPDF